VWHLSLLEGRPLRRRSGEVSAIISFTARAYAVGNACAPVCPSFGSIHSSFHARSTYLPRCLDRRSHSAAS
jgi:hypothetical protein